MATTVRMTVTLKDIAAKAGVSAMAVSMALRNHPRVSESTRSRVKLLAERMGYIRNPAYARLSGHRVRRARELMPMALVRQANPGSIYRPPTYITQLRKVALRFGYSIHVFETDRELTARRLGGVLYSRGIEAVLLGPVYDKAFLGEFPFERFSVVACEAGHYRPPCHVVMLDIAQAMDAAVRCCLERGYRRLALAELAEPVPPVDALDRESSRLRCGQIAREAGAAWEAREFDTAGGDRFAQWIRRFRPDVVIDQTGFFYWALRERGWGIPRDLSCLVLQLNPEREQHLSGYIEDHARVGGLAIKLLDGEVRDFGRGRPEVVSRILVEMAWREGGTLPGPRRR